MFYAMKCLFFCFPYQANPYAFVACTIASRVLTAAPESIVFAASAMPSAILSAFFPIYKAAPAFKSTISLFGPCSFPERISLVICAFTAPSPPCSFAISHLFNPNCSGDNHSPFYPEVHHGSRNHFRKCRGIHPYKHCPGTGWIRKRS